MRLRSVLLSIASIAVGVLLIVALVSIAKVDVHAALRQVVGANRAALLRLTALMAVLILLSAGKWRMIDKVLLRPDDGLLSGAAYFAITSAGVALGQVLPIPMSMVVARVLGTHFQGSALKRGTVGTLCDQGTDFLMVCFLIPASVVTRMYFRTPRVWIVMGAGMSLLIFSIVPQMTGLLGWLARHFAGVGAGSRSRWRQALRELSQFGLLEPRLVRKLMSLAMLRFVVLVLMADETSRAVALSVPVWHLAAAMPFVVISSALAVTPGGIGLNELTYTTALTLFGTPLAIAAQWSLANRVLTAAAAFGVAAWSWGAFLVWKSLHLFRRDPVLDHAG